jgi:hypothetical protein
MTKYPRAKAAHKQAAPPAHQRVADKRQFLAARRRERQREHWAARGEAAGAAQGRLKGLVDRRHDSAAAPVGIGMTLCNRAAYLSEAVESLGAVVYLIQLMLVDDGSTDETGRLRDGSNSATRVCRACDSPNGAAVAAWREAFEQASRMVPVAWASDHDRWHQWLRQYAR